MSSKSNRSSIALASILALAITLATTPVLAQAINLDPQSGTAKPYDFENSPLNPKNNECNPDNSPLFPGNPRILWDGEPYNSRYRYMTPRSDGGVNIYTQDGHFVGAIPGPGR